MVSYNGFDAKYITMQNTEGGAEDVKIGDFVKVEENGVINLAAAGETFIGIVVGINGDYFTVQVSGYAEVKFEGETLAMYSRLVLNTRGKLQSEATTDAPLRRVLWVDRVERKAGIII